MDTIYFLEDFRWERGLLVSEGRKNFKIHIPRRACYPEQTKYVAKEKCARPDEKICVVWEQWRGANGRGGYRVERELYPQDRVAAHAVACQSHGPGRVNEQESKA